MCKLTIPTKFLVEKYTVCEVFIVLPAIKRKNILILFQREGKIKMINPTLILKEIVQKESDDVGSAILANIINLTVENKLCYKYFYP